MGRKSKRNITNKKRKHHKKNTKHRRRRVNITRKKGGLIRNIVTKFNPGLSKRLYPNWNAEQQAMQQPLPTPPTYEWNQEDFERKVREHAYLMNKPISYEERLRRLNLMKLKERRIRI